MTQQTAASSVPVQSRLMHVFTLAGLGTYQCIAKETRASPFTL